MDKATSWKTSTAGWLGIAATVISVLQAIFGAHPHPIDPVQTIAGLSMGVGLIKAKDSDVTGGDRKQ